MPAVFNAGRSLWQCCFASLEQARSLREITGGLAAAEGRLNHLGIASPPSRSTLAYANEHQPWQLFAKTFEHFYQHCRAEALHRTGRQFRFEHKLLSLDTTVIPL